MSVDRMLNWFEKAQDIVAASVIGTFILGVLVLFVTVVPLWLTLSALVLLWAMVRMLGR